MYLPHIIMIFHRIMPPKWMKLVVAFVSLWLRDIKLELTTGLGSYDVLKHHTISHASGSSKSIGSSPERNNIESPNASIKEASVSLTSLKR